MARDIHDYDSLKEAYGDLLMFERFPGPVRSERVEEFLFSSSETSENTSIGFPITVLSVKSSILSSSLSSCLTTPPAIPRSGLSCGSRCTGPTAFSTSSAAPVSSLPPASGSFAVAVAGTPIILFRSICKEVRMEINITYKSPEHEAAFLSELQRIPRIVNPESGRVNPYWGASLYLLSALTRWPELRIAVIGEDYMAFTAAKEAFNLSQNERIVVELAAAFYNAGLWEMPGFEMVCATCDTAFALILEAFRLRRAKLFFKDGEVYAE